MSAPTEFTAACGPPLVLTAWVPPSQLGGVQDIDLSSIYLSLRVSSESAGDADAAVMGRCGCRRGCIGQSWACCYVGWDVVVYAERFVVWVSVCAGEF